MPLQGMAFRQGTIGLPYYREGITDQLNIMQPKGLGQFECAD